MVVKFTLEQIRQNLPSSKFAVLQYYSYNLHIYTHNFYIDRKPRIPAFKLYWRHVFAKFVPSLCQVCVVKLDIALKPLHRCLCATYEHKEETFSLPNKNNEFMSSLVRLSAPLLDCHEKNVFIES